MSEQNNFTAEIQKMGRIAVPYETRKFLDIEEGDLIVIEIKGIKHSNKQETKVSDMARRLLVEYLERIAFKEAL